MPPDLAEDDKAIIVELLRGTIERDRFPRSPRITGRAASGEARGQLDAGDALAGTKAARGAECGVDEEAAAVRGRSA